MAEHGITDIFIAYPIVVPSKIERAIRLSRDIRLSLGVDSWEGAKLLSGMAAKHNVELTVLLELDTGLRRTGVAVERAVDLAVEIAKLPHLKLEGIFTFKGAVYQGQSTLDLRAAGLEEGRQMVDAAERMRERGLSIERVSVGSTPTAPYAAQVEGVTEIRPGTYIFYDRMQTRLQVCSPEDWAASVIVTVVSIPSPDLVVIDGGSKTFATDVQPNQPPLNLQGFGTVMGYPDAVLERMNEEHGMIRMNGPHSLAIGDTLAIVPNHICSTINLHDTVYLKDGDQLEAVDVLARGKVR
ncbi:alanine racemase [Paenibacillus sp. J2TS4]|nr:alanine racemase [Paenibacillus sp. J2TS4]